MMILVDRIISQHRENALQRRPEGTMTFDPIEESRNLPSPPFPPPQHSSSIASPEAGNELVTSALKSSIASLRNKILPPKPPFGNKSSVVSQGTSATGINLLADRSRTMTPTENIGGSCCQRYARVVLIVRWWQRKICSLRCLPAAKRALTGSRVEAR